MEKFSLASIKIDSSIGKGNGNPLRCSCLENPREGGAWWAAVYGVTQSRTRLKWLSSSSKLCLAFWGWSLYVSKKTVIKCITHCVASDNWNGSSYSPGAGGLRSRYQQDRTLSEGSGGKCVPCLSLGFWCCQPSLACLGSLPPWSLGHLSSVCLYLHKDSLFSVSICVLISFCKVTSYIGLGHTPMTSFNLNYQVGLRKHHYKQS